MAEFLQKARTVHLKIQKQISSTCQILKNNKKHEWTHECNQVLSVKRQAEYCTERYLRGLRNQNGEHLVDLMNQTYKSYSL